MQAIDENFLDDAKKKYIFFGLKHFTVLFKFTKL